MSLPRERSAVNRTKVEQPCLNTEQFSFASSHLLTTACWHVQGTCLWWEDHVFRDKTGGLFGWGQRRMSPLKDLLFSREHLQPWAAQGSCWVWSLTPPDLPWIQEPDFTGSSYPNLPTWESTTQRTRRNYILMYVKSHNRGKKRAFESLLNLSIKLYRHAFFFKIKILLQVFL